MKPSANSTTTTALIIRDAKGKRLPIFTNPANLPENGEPLKTPWNGFWWPSSNRGLDFRWQGKDDPSPMEKYVAITGKTEALNWELKKNNTAKKDICYLDDEKKSSCTPKEEDVGWYGQCDGFSIASAVEPEPKLPINCRGERFEVGDIKGLLGALYLGDVSGQNVDWLGKNQHAETGGKDLDPATFHLAITNVMGVNQQPIYLDLPQKPGEIFNYPLAGYEISQMEKVYEGEKKFLSVKMVLKIVDYETIPSKQSAPLITSGIIPRAPDSTLDYLLELDEKGNIIPGSGEWKEGSLPRRPQALKFPRGTAQKTKWVNPHLDMDLIKEIAALSAGTSTDRKLCDQKTSARKPMKSQSAVGSESTTEEAK